MVTLLWFPLEVYRGTPYSWVERVYDHIAQIGDGDALWMRLRAWEIARYERDDDEDD